MIWLYLLLISVMFLFIVAFYLNEKDILAPPVVMCEMFILSVSIAIIFSDTWGIKSYRFDAYMILVSGIATFLLGDAFYKLPKSKYKLYMPANKKEKIETVLIEPLNVQEYFLIFMIVFDVIVLLLYVQAIGRIYGRSGASLSILIGLFRSSTGHMTIMDDYERVNVILSQTMKIVEVAGLVSGYVFVNNLFSRQKNRMQQAGLLILFGLSVFPSFLAGARGGVLRLLAAILFYYYVLYNRKYQWKRNVSWKFVRIGFAIIAVGVPLFYFSLNWIGRTTDFGMFEYIAKYIGSSIFLFSDYLKNPASGPIVFGEESLIGVHTFLYRLGIDTYVRDANLEYRMLHSNVYTFFRRPLHDFGIIGMYIFTVFVAFFFSWLYNGKIKRALQSDKTHIWTIIMGYLFYWLVISSILQYSWSYISLNFFIKVILIIIMFKVMIRTKLRSKK